MSLFPDIPIPDSKEGQALHCAITGNTTSLNLGNLAKIIWGSGVDREVGFVFLNK